MLARSDAAHLDGMGRVDAHHLALAQTPGCNKVSVSQVALAGDPDEAQGAGRNVHRRRHRLEGVAEAVSANARDRCAGGVIDLGAAGYLPKSSGLVDLQQALQTVLDGERWIPAMLRETVARVAPFSKDADLAARLSSLSAHQYKVLSLVAEGLLNKQIADRLGVQLRTVKAHMTRIMGRLGVRNRAQAIRVLHEMGLNDPSRQIEETQDA